MGQDASEIRVASSGSINVAPVGTTLPTTPTASLNSAFVELGFTTEDGVTFTDTPTIEEIRAWQSADPVRRLVTQRVLTVAFSLEQVNQENFLVAFGGGTWTQPSAGIYKFTPPAPSDPLAELAMVIRAQDGDENDQYTVYRGNITEAIESQLTRSAAQLLPITFSALTPVAGGAAWNFQTDDDVAFGLLS